MTEWLKQQGHWVNEKRVRRLLRKMGLMAIYRKPRLSQPVQGAQVYPYLLRGVKVERADQVWSADITYVRLCAGFIYLVAIIDWYSRYVLSWEVSVTQDASFCVSALERALECHSQRHSTPIRERSSQVKSSQGGFNQQGYGSVWTDEGGSSTTFLWSDYGEV